MDYHQDNPAVFFTTIKNTKQLVINSCFLYVVLSFISCYVVFVVYTSLSLDAEKLVQKMNFFVIKTCFKPSVLCHNLQKVPEEFLKHLNKDLWSNSVLIGPSGDKWQVTILKKGNNVYMDNGWSQFLKDNSVVLDEFLLFTYHGGNCFYVQIFGGNGLERLCLKETRQEQAVTPQFLGENGLERLQIWPLYSPFTKKISHFLNFSFMFLNRSDF